MLNEIRIIPGCRSVRAPGSYGEIFLLPLPPDETVEPSCWMIAQYKDQTGLATALRHSEPLQEFVTDCHARLGLRASDRPPVGVERQKRYGTTTVGANCHTDFTRQRLYELAKPILGGLPSMNRRTDRDENVQTFWATQTPQSHHVVEFNHLRDIGVSRESGIGEMDHGQLPCVLLSADFHQRYISSILKQTHGWSADRLRKQLGQVYASIYANRGAIFQPLWKVSRVILRAAGILTH